MFGESKKGSEDGVGVFGELKKDCGVVVGMFGESKKGRGDVVEMFGEPKMGCGDGVGVFGKPKKSRGNGVGGLSGSKKGYGDDVGGLAVSFWHKSRRGDAFLAPPLSDFRATGGLLHVADFGREEDAEAIADGAADALGKEGDLVAGGVAVVDDDERLVFVNADFTLAEAFESATLDEPAGGDFDASVGRRIGRDVGVEGAEGVELGAVDEGVHEEAAGVSEAFGVGQFAVANGADGLANVADSGAGKGTKGVA